MRVLDALFGRNEQRAISYQDFWGRGADLAGKTTVAGENITDRRALCLSAVYGSIRILAEGVSKLPARTTRGTGPNAEQVAQPPAWLDMPSPLVKHIGIGEVIDQIMVSLLLRGNAYVLTPRDSRGFITELQVLNPDQVQPYIPERGPRRVFFRVAGDPNYDQDDIAMAVGLSRPGEIIGMSPIDHAAETIGLGLAATEFGAAFFGNGANPSGLIELDQQLSPEGEDMLRSSWKKLHSGKRAGGVAVLTEGAKFRQLSVTPENAQFLETRGFQVADIARFFGVPPHLLQDASGSTSWGSGLAEQSVNYVTHALRPWVERIEAMLTRMARSERPGVQGQRRIHITLSMDHLLRGDFATRMDTVVAGVMNGLLTPDEGRLMVDNLPPLPDGAGGTARFPLNTAPQGEAQ